MTDDPTRHDAVLVEELMKVLEPREDGAYVDCTFGRGGHTRALLSRLGRRGRVFALDRDPEAIAVAETLARRDDRLHVSHAAFSELERSLGSSAGRVDGIVFDLGVSSPQLARAERGFSFRNDGPLDMRMDPGQGQSAAEWLAVASREQIERVLREFGEERHARRIARAIVEQRTVAPLRTTTQLARVVSGALPARARHAERGQHPATRSFQAIRIHVNRELEELDAGLAQALECLRVAGRLAVISFHSLEDRRVKRFIRDNANPPRPSRHDPVPLDAPQPRLRPVGKAIRPSAAERTRNPRARSAVLRCAERIH